MVLQNLPDWSKLFCIQSFPNVKSTRSPCLTTYSCLGPLLAMGVEAGIALRVGLGLILPVSCPLWQGLVRSWAAFEWFGEPCMAWVCRIWLDLFATETLGESLPDFADMAPSCVPCCCCWGWGGVRSMVGLLSSAEAPTAPPGEAWDWLLDAERRDWSPEVLASRRLVLYNCSWKRKADLHMQFDTFTQV